MKVTQSEFKAYTRVLQENSIDGDHMLELLQEIVNGEWAQSISFCDDNRDPMDDFNYPGSKYHY